MINEGRVAYGVITTSVTATPISNPSLGGLDAFAQEILQFGRFSTKFFLLAEF